MFDSTIWVAVIEHKHGFNHYANQTEEGAYQTLYDYVSEWWHDLDPDFAGEPLPEITDFTPDDAIVYYFEHVYEEWYTLQEVTLGG